MEWLITIGAMGRKWLRIADRRLMVPVLEWWIAFFVARLEKRGRAVEGLAQWKQRALMDFRLWIAELPEAPLPRETAGTPSPDLFTLLSEFAGLRQEIRMQNREQNRSLREMEDVRRAFDEARNLFNEKSHAFDDRLKENARALEAMEERIRRAAEKKALLPFLEVRDALERGLAAARSAAETPPKRRGWFRTAPQAMEGMIKGYEMALRRCDRALAQADIRPLAALGNPFDPERMRAVSIRSAPEAEKGQVVSVQLVGFVRGSEVIRTAEVIVGE